MLLTLISDSSRISTQLAELTEAVKKLHPKQTFEEVVVITKLFHFLAFHFSILKYFISTMKTPYVYKGLRWN